MLKIKRSPCPSCPYRCDVPSGVWDVSEYKKLPLYDQETSQQPVGVFLCHWSFEGRDCLCRGWLDTHVRHNPAGHELLSLRLGLSMGAVDQEQLKSVIVDSPSVPVFSSGRQACDHGMLGVSQPSAEALDVIRKVVRAKSR